MHVQHLHLCLHLHAKKVERLYVSQHIKKINYKLHRTVFFTEDAINALLILADYIGTSFIRNEVLIQSRR